MKQITIEFNDGNWFVVFEGFFVAMHLQTFAMAYEHACTVRSVCDSMKQQSTIIVDPNSEPEARRAFGSVYDLVFGDKKGQSVTI